MIQFSAPAKYRRHIEAALALALDEIGRDAHCREDEDVRVQELAPVPDHLVEPDVPGRILIAIAADTPEGIGQLGDHLHAFLTGTR